MISNSYKIMFLLTLMMGTMITVSSNSWLSAWMGLEINLLSFIPLISSSNMMSTESSLKYFLIQALASIVLLFSVLLGFLNNFYMFNMNFNGVSMLIISSLFLKMGVAPFHFWFPSVMKGMSWFSGFILMTWQKIAPFMLMTYLMIKPLMMFGIICSAIFGAIGGLAQTSTFKLMAYSSINHLSWMMLASLNSENLWMLYFIFYTFLSLTVILMFYFFKIDNLSQMFSNLNNFKLFKFMMFLNLLSLGGLPPFLGFFPKWTMIQYLTFSDHFFILTLLIMSSMVTLYFYLRLCYSAFMLNNSHNNWTIQMQLNSSSIMLFTSCSTLSMMGLMIISFIYVVL